MDQTIKLTALNVSHASLGVIISYLSKRKPFADHSVGTLAVAIRVQLETRNHLIALKDDIIVGYAGWMRVTDENAARWLRKEASLVQVNGPEATTAALTIFVADLKAVTPMLIRGARELNQDVRVVFHRGYELTGKPAKKQTVVNFREK